MQIHYKACTTYMPKTTKKRQRPNPCWMDTHQTNVINVLYVKKIHQNILETLWQWKTTLQPCLRNKQKIFKSAKTLAKKTKKSVERHMPKNTQRAGRSRYCSSKAKCVTAMLQEPKPTHQKRKKEEKKHTKSTPGTPPKENI